MNEPSMSPPSIAPEVPEDHQALEEAQVYERYLQGRLPEEDAQRFEQHFADCGYCLEQLETTEALLDGLRRAATEDAAQVDAARGVAVAWFLRRRVAWGLAVLGIVLAAWGGWRSVDLERRLEALQTPTSVTWSQPLSLSLAPLRGGGPSGQDDPVHRLRLPAQPTPLQLTLPLTLPPGGRYDVVLATSTGDSLWRLDDLGANADGELRLTVPSTVMEPGFVVLSVDTVDEGSDTRSVARLRFEVVPPESTTQGP